MLLAMGFVGPEREGLLDRLGVELTERGNVARDGDSRRRCPACSSRATWAGASR